MRTRKCSCSSEFVPLSRAAGVLASYCRPVSHSSNTPVCQVPRRRRIALPCTAQVHACRTLRMHRQFRKEENRARLKGEFAPPGLITVTRFRHAWKKFSVRVSEEQAHALFIKYGCDSQGMLPYDMFATKLLSSPARLLALEPEQKVRRCPAGGGRGEARAWREYVDCSFAMSHGCKAGGIASLHPSIPLTGPVQGGQGRILPRQDCVPLLPQTRVPALQLGRPAGAALRAQAQGTHLADSYICTCQAGHRLAFRQLAKYRSQ